MSYIGKKVLIIRFSSIGDIILTTPIVRSVKTQWNAKVVFMTFEKNKHILFQNPNIDEVISYENSPPLKDFDLIIDLQKNRKSILFCLKSGIKTVSFDKQNINKWLFTTFKINRLPKIHLVDRYFIALEQMGLVNDHKGLDFYYMEGMEMPFDLPKEYIVLNCGGTYYTKRIPFEKCQEIIGFTSMKVILLGGTDVESVGRQLEHLPNVINLIGKTNLNQSAHIIQHGLYLITSDSAMMHIGAALQKEMTVLWGNTTKELGMFPYYGKLSDRSYQDNEVELNCRPCSKLGYAQCPKKHFKCMMEQDVSNIKLTDLN